MLREGPIPRFVHGLVEYVAGAFLVAAPFLLGYDDLNMPLGVSIATGVVILVLAAITEGPTGLVKQLPVSAHVTFDFLLAIFLIAAPFLLGFGDEPAPRNLFIVLGVAHLLISIGTRYRDPVPDAGATSRHGSSPKRSTSPPASGGSSSAPSARPPVTPTRPAATGSSPAPVERPAQAPRPAPDKPPTAPDKPPTAPPV